MHMKSTEIKSYTTWEKHLALQRHLEAKLRKFPIVSFLTVSCDNTTTCKYCGENENPVLTLRTTLDTKNLWV